eukprot:TsM_000330100 transcript=TsM_000330100 gene=TsM_000330100
MVARPKWKCREQILFSDPKRRHTGEKLFHCTDCQHAFSNRSNLRAHRQAHMVVKRYRCPTATHHSITAVCSSNTLPTVHSPLVPEPSSRMVILPPPPPLQHTTSAQSTAISNASST